MDEQTGESRGDLKRVTSGPDWKPRPEVSAGGKRLAFLRTNIAPTVYVADVDAKTKTLKKLQRLTLDESRSRPYEWTPDGKAILYISDRDGEFHIYRQRIDAVSPELLVDGNDSPSIMRLNPDATEILYNSEVKHPGNEGAHKWRRGAILAGGGRNKQFSVCARTVSGMCVQQIHEGRIGICGV